MVTPEDQPTLPLAVESEPALVRTVEMCVTCGQPIWLRETLRLERCCECRVARQMPRTPPKPRRQKAVGKEKNQ